MQECHKGYAKLCKSVTKVMQSYARVLQRLCKVIQECLKSYAKLCKSVAKVMQSYARVSQRLCKTVRHELDGCLILGKYTVNKHNSGLIKALCCNFIKYS